MKAFYFSKLDKKLSYGDNRVIKTGVTHKVDGPIEPCVNGLHASKRIIDALKYAPGAHLWLVDLSGEVVVSDDKVCASERKYLAGFNAEKLLREFARKQALINIEKIKPYCSESDHSLIINWLKTGDIKFRSAAYSAAYSAARSAARSAWSAAWSARSAAESAWSAAWSAANDMLLSMLEEKAPRIINKTG